MDEARRTAMPIEFPPFPLQGMAETHHDYHRRIVVFAAHFNEAIIRLNAWLGDIKQDDAMSVHPVRNIDPPASTRSATESIASSQTARSTDALSTTGALGLG